MPAKYHSIAIHGTLFAGRYMKRGRIPWHTNAVATLPHLSCSGVYCLQVVGAQPSLAPIHRPHLGTSPQHPFTVSQQTEPGTRPSPALGFWGKNIMLYAGTMAFHRDFEATTYTSVSRVPSPGRISEKRAQSSFMLNIYSTTVCGRSRSRPLLPKRRYGSIYGIVLILSILDLHVDVSRVRYVRTSTSMLMHVY